MDLLSACKLAYRKHVLNDDSVGWDELGDCLLDAICNEIGDEGFQEFLKNPQPEDAFDRATSSAFGGVRFTSPHKIKLSDGSE